MMLWPDPKPTIRAKLAAPIVAEPLTLDEGKLRAGLDWIDGDPRDALMNDFIAAARAQVEADTGIAVPEQSRDLLFDWIPAFVPWRDLPPQSTPLTSVTSVSAVDSTGTTTPLDAAAYTVTLTNDGLAITILTPPADVQRYVVRVVAGFAVDAIPPSLRQAVGLLTSHYATVGRDLTIVGTIVAPTPLGYAEAIRPWVIEVLT